MKHHSSSYVDAGHQTEVVTPQSVPKTTPRKFRTRSETCIDISYLSPSRAR